jgi:hypothetical protein
MWLLRLGCVLATAGVLAGCGGKPDPQPSAKATAAPAAPAATPTATATKAASPVATLTSASDLAACAQLEQAVQAVSSLVGHTTEGITKALHPKELAKRTATAQQSLLDSAKLIKLVKDMPEPLVGPQLQFEQGLRMFAADFGRATASASQGDIAGAAQRTVDKTALRKIQSSAKRIDDLCGA